MHKKNWKMGAKITKKEKKKLRIRFRREKIRLPMQKKNFRIWNSRSGSSQIETIFRSIPIMETMQTESKALEKFSL